MLKRRFLATLLSPANPRAMRTAILIASLLIGILGCSGCQEPYTDVQLTGSLPYGECGEILPWSARFASWAETNATDAVMRFQTHSNNAHVKNDTLLFVIKDAKSLMDDPTTPIDVGDREYADAGASANLAFWASCPDEYALSVYLHGTLQFDELSRDKDGPIRGTFTGEARDQRTGEVLGAGVQLSFDFERSERTPWQAYTPRN